jgi:hypothetical protein
MANNYIENLESRIDLNNTFQRVFPQPIDRSSIFGSFTDAQKYAKGDGTDDRKLGGSSYIGQIITVYERDAVNTYCITPNRQLKKIGGECVKFANSAAVLTQIVINPFNAGFFIYSTVDKATAEMVNMEELKEYSGPGLYILYEGSDTLGVKCIISMDDKENIIFDVGEF